MKLERPLVTFDLETTGVDINNDRIVQFGAVKTMPDGSTEEKLVLINPGIPIPAATTDVHGITDEDVKDSPKFNQIAKSFLQWLSGCDLCGYNIDNFDVPLLIKEFERAGIQYPAENINFIDVIKIERQVNSHKLENTYQRYTGEKLANAHNALADAKATWSILQKQLELNKEVIPDEAEQLDAFCQGDKKRVDYAGKLYKKDEEVFWNFGKHSGELVRNTLDYAKWVLESNFPEETKKQLRLIMNK